MDSSDEKRVEVHFAESTPPRDTEVTDPPEEETAPPTEGSLENDLADAINQAVGGQFNVGRVPDAADCLQVIMDAQAATQKRRTDKDVLEATQASVAASHFTTVLGYLINWVVGEIKEKGHDAVRQPLAQVAMQVKGGKIYMPICEADRLGEILNQMRDAMPGYRLDVTEKITDPDTKEIRIEADLDI